MITIYIIGMIIVGVIFGFVDSPTGDDLSVAWMISIFWPLFLLLAILTGIVHAPVWIGSKIRKIMDKKSAKKDLS